MEESRVLQLSLPRYLQPAYTRLPGWLMFSICSGGSVAFEALQASGYILPAL
jgi:hypothetical protein